MIHRKGMGTNLIKVLWFLFGNSHMCCLECLKNTDVGRIWARKWDLVKRYTALLFMISHSVFLQKTPM